MVIHVLHKQGRGRGVVVGQIMTFNNMGGGGFVSYEGICSTPPSPHPEPFGDRIKYIVIERVVQLVNHMQNFVNKDCYS